ncbi:MAG: DNA repair protein RadC [Bacteroidales bacterium]|nr:DNA repair protein RadC [Bacteroidales bacterium]
MAYTSIKDWRREERPREKMLERGANALTDAELLAVLIHTGSSNSSAVDLARKLLDGAGSTIRGLSNYSLNNFTRVKGIGTAKALTLMAAFEAGRRSMAAGRDSELVITDASSAVDLIAPRIANLSHEECWGIFLNRANKVILKERLSSGGISSTTFDVRMVVKRAVDTLASSIILIHNHPSGNPEPGENDRTQTVALRNAAALLDISLLDHIIVARNKYFSFSEENYRKRRG